ncbi:unnamed protein product [Phytophthora fragariaefolia]|uniref:Unnamed protein product n=1 Tax=Phytophthora fragariaefolia TaxID=1490495 RepID=A0A9W6XQU7_9STRA|nr:unnamed protein product [Phytophthora fragariaefolia]
MLANTGATLRLVDPSVLRRLGRSGEQLLPYEGLVRSSSGHMLRIRGWINVELRLGNIVVTKEVLVADRLHANAILGVDALGAFGAVIDVGERNMMLIGTGEVLPLGALVMANLVGDAAETAVVLVEGSVGLPPTLCVARTLCSMTDGQAIVELCNASTEEFWVTKGTVVASVSVVPESAFASESKTDDDSKYAAASEVGETVAIARRETTAVDLGGGGHGSEA